MALTLRTNGSGSPNLIAASWWNDYYTLLTGTMSDQAVLINQSVSLKGQIAPATGMTATPIVGTGMGVGLYNYAVTFGNAEAAETSLSPTVAATTTSSNKQVTLAAIPTGPAGTTVRNIYRSKVGGGQFYVLHQIADNTTLTYTDAAADTTLTVLSQVDPSLGGLILKDSTNTINGWITGAVSNRLAIDGSTLVSLAVAGNEQIQLKSDGGQYFPNGMHLGITSKGDILDVVGSTTYIKASGGSVIFQSPNGTSNATITSSGAFNVTQVNFNTGSIKDINHWAGGGSGTYSHGLSGTPAWTGAIDNTASTQAMGVDSQGSSTVHITCESGHALIAMAYR